MKPLDRDLTIIQKMLKYCNEIDEAHNSFGRSYEAFTNNSVYRNAVSMCLMQIGELSNHLSGEFKDSYPAIPWYQIRGMRNVVGTNDVEIVWETATEDIVVIRAFCSEVID